MYRRIGEPQGRSGWVWKISPPPGFDPRTVQPIANRYTDCAILAHRYIGGVEVYLHSFLTSALRVSERLASRPGRFTNGPKAGFDALQKAKSLAPNDIRTPDNPACSAVAITTTVISHAEFLRYKTHNQIIPPIPTPKLLLSSTRVLWERRLSDYVTIKFPSVLPFGS
jgi:hypothetical protein